MDFAIFQSIGHAGEIVFEQLPARSRAIHSGQHAGIRGRFYDPVHLWKRFEVARVTDVTMNDRRAGSFEICTIGFRSGPHEIVDTEDRDALDVLDEPLRYRRPRKTTDTCNQDSHRVCFMNTTRGY